MKKILLLLFMLVSVNAFAVNDAVYVGQSTKPTNDVYNSVYAALEKNGFYVVFEPNIGKNISGMAKRWGDDYNRNKLESIRSMVFCNGWYANQVSNAEPTMLALCPLHVTVTSKAGITKVLFVRPDYVAKGSAAEKIATELTQDVIKAIEAGL